MGKRGVSDDDVEAKRATKRLKDERYREKKKMEAKEIQTQIQQQEKQINSLQQTIINQQQIINQQKQTEQHSQKQIQTLQEQFQTQQQIITQFQANISKHEATISNHEATIFNQQTTISNQDSIISDQVAIISNQITTIFQQETDISNNKKQIFKQKSIIFSLLQKDNQFIYTTLLSRRLDSQSSLLNTAQHTIQQLTKTSTSLQQTILTQETKLTQQQDTVSQLQDTLATLQQTNNSLSQINIDNTKKIQDQAAQLTIFFILLHNIKQLIPTFKKQIKYEMVRKIITGITKEDVRKYLSIPLITVRRIMGDVVRKPKFIFRTKRELRILLAKKILNDLLPMVSGRDYRIQLMTTKEVYRRYKLEVWKVGQTNNNTHIPLSSKKIWGILKKWRIHHSKDTSQCPDCKLLECYSNGQPPPSNLRNIALTKWKKKHGDIPPPANLEEKAIEKWRKKLAKVQASPHKQIAQAQHRAHKQAKQELITSKTTNKIILLQDFTQLVPQNGFNQDMIITTLRYDENEVDNIKREYFHFVGDSGDSNNQCFVMSVWEYMLTTKTIITDNVNNIEIWSDGGGKHFKCKETMFYFSTIKSRYNKTITYNFYQAYHGHNSCDAAASHAKKAIREGQGDTGLLCYTVFDLVNYINTVKNHHAQLVPQFQNTTLKVSNLAGIKSYFKFTFPERGQISAFTISADVQPKKMYRQKETQFPF